MKAMLFSPQSFMSVDGFVFPSELSGNMSLRGRVAHTSKMTPRKMVGRVPNLSHPARNVAIGETRKAVLLLISLVTSLSITELRRTRGGDMVFSYIPIDSESPPMKAYPRSVV